MSDNPFSEPDDNDRTVIRPVPGGRRGAPSPQPAPSPVFRDAPSPARGAASIPIDGAETISFGLNPLIEAAAPLLQLLGRLRNTYSQPDPGDLRERAIQQIRAFEQASRDGGVPMDQLRPAHYALCASLDDVVLNTPWGSSGPWAARSLVSTFHQEVRSGERFFDLLTQLRQNPGTFLPVLELMFTFASASASRDVTASRHAAPASSIACARTSTPSSRVSGRPQTRGWRRIGRACRLPTGRRAPRCRHG